MIQYLEDMKGIGIAPLTTDEKAELVKLRKEHQKLKTQFETQETVAPKKKAAVDSDSSEDEVSGNKLQITCIGRR